MPVLVSISALHRGDVRVEGVLTPEEHGVETLDPCVKASGPLKYAATCQLMGPEVLVEGFLEIQTECECVRCLASFQHVQRIDPWAALLALGARKRRRGWTSRWT